MVINPLHLEEWGDRFFCSRPNDLNKSMQDTLFVLEQVMISTGYRVFKNPESSAVRIQRALGTRKICDDVGINGVQLRALSVLETSVNTTETVEMIRTSA